MFNYFYEEMHCLQEKRSLQTIEHHMVCQFLHFCVFTTLYFLHQNFFKRCIYHGQPRYWKYSQTFIWYCPSDNISHCRHVVVVQMPPLVLKSLNRNQTWLIAVEGWLLHHVWLYSIIEPIKSSTFFPTKKCKKRDQFWTCPEDRLNADFAGGKKLLHFFEIRTIRGSFFKLDKILGKLSVDTILYYPIMALFIDSLLLRMIHCLVVLFYFFYFFHTKNINITLPI